MEIKTLGAHLDHLIRQTRDHHVDLSAMADMKANILMTVATLVITLSVRYIEDPHLKWAVIVLIFFCLLTLGLTIYAVMPKLPFRTKPATAAEAKRRNFNILFFGDFARMRYSDYEDAMERVLNDHNLVYESQLQELYTLGTFLMKSKYRYLRLAYTSFLVGSFTAAAVGVMTGALSGFDYF